jgi:hypothetical protein
MLLMILTVNSDFFPYSIDGFIIGMKPQYVYYEVGTEFNILFK